MICIYNNKEHNGRLIDHETIVVRTYPVRWNAPKRRAFVEPRMQISKLQTYRHTSSEQIQAYSSTGVKNYTRLPTFFFFFFPFFYPSFLRSFSLSFFLSLSLSCLLACLFACFLPSSLPPSLSFFLILFFFLEIKHTRLPPHRHRTVQNVLPFFSNETLA